jgi:SAM-dependent methyltransferase
MPQNLFDLSQQYDAMLQKGLSLSGEDKTYFMKGRIRDLLGRLPCGYRPQRILDFGCGIGDAARYLADLFPHARVLGIDTSDQALDLARQRHGSERVAFSDISAFSEAGTIDLCYVSGVFHHIAPPERPRTLRMIHDALAPGGYLAFFENNPWNPGTRLVMHRIPFDRDAHPISPRQALCLLRQGGFMGTLQPRFMFYFPRSLAFLRFTERWLTRLPLGAQYYVLARK